MKNVKSTLLPLFAALLLATALSSCNPSPKSRDLPRSEPSAELENAMAAYLEKVQGILSDTIPFLRQEIHSIMIVKDGKVVQEKYLRTTPEEPHVLFSVSKTFTATAVGLAISEGKLSLSDKLIDFFPDYLPADLGENLPKVTVEHLLTMTCGHDVDPTGAVLRYKPEEGEEPLNWARYFLSHPFVHEPGTFYCYNTIGTYMLSAIVQKVTGEKIVDYLTPRLFEPLGIDKPRWDESPQGINAGGFGLYLRTEDMAKMGQLFLQKGRWRGKQVLPKDWVGAASSFKVPCVPAGMRPDSAAAAGLTKENSDWVQGYGYQMWMCRHGAYRADGANGQYIIVCPEQNAVIAVTADLMDMQREINDIWDILLPALR